MPGPCLLLTLPSQWAGWGWTREQVNKLTPLDQRSVPDHIRSWLAKWESSSKIAFWWWLTGHRSACGKWLLLYHLGFFLFCFSPSLINNCLDLQGFFPRFYPSDCLPHRTGESNEWLGGGLPASWGQPTTDIICLSVCPSLSNPLFLNPNTIQRIPVSTERKQVDMAWVD